VDCPLSRIEFHHAGQRPDDENAMLVHCACRRERSPSGRLFARSRTIFAAAQERADLIGFMLMRWNARWAFSRRGAVVCDRRRDRGARGSMPGWWPPAGRPRRHERVRVERVSNRVDDRREGQVPAGTSQRPSRKGVRIRVSRGEFRGRRPCFVNEPRETASANTVKLPARMPPASKLPFMAGCRSPVP